MSSLCIVTMTTAGRSFGLAFICTCSCLVEEFPAQLFRHSTHSLLGLPHGTFRPPREDHQGVYGCMEPAALLAAVRRILLAETLGNTVAISESLTTFITSFCCGFTSGYLSAPLTLP